MWPMPVISASEELKQPAPKFEGSLGYIARLYIKGGGAGMEVSTVNGEPHGMEGFDISKVLKRLGR